MKPSKNAGPPCLRTGPSSTASRTVLIITPFPWPSWCNGWFFPDVSGILFTADPVTGHRRTVSIDAGFGLGEGLVSGIVTADLYKVRDDEIIQKQIAKKEKGVFPAAGGGTEVRELPSELRQKQALPDPKIYELGSLGTKGSKNISVPNKIWNGVWKGMTFTSFKAGPSLPSIPSLPAKRENTGSIFPSVTRK